MVFKAIKNCIKFKGTEGNVSNPSPRISWIRRKFRKILSICANTTGKSQGARESELSGKGVFASSEILLEMNKIEQIEDMITWEDFLESTNPTVIPPMTAVTGIFDSENSPSDSFEYEEAEPVQSIENEEASNSSDCWEDSYECTEAATCTNTDTEFDDADISVEDDFSLVVYELNKSKIANFQKKNIKCEKRKKACQMANQQRIWFLTS